MTDNMKLLIGNITSTINQKFGDDLPTIDQINQIAEALRAALSGMFPVSDNEFEYIKTRLHSDILHKIGFETTLRGHDDTHKSWYFTQENDGYYWNRYKIFLKDRKHWGIDIVNRLNQTTDAVMDELGNPKDHERQFQRRGLLLGDVQSGKTATYTAICNKAADAGYRVIIVLAGITNNLRFQTQERLDGEFVGIDSEYTLDRTAGSEIRNTPIGVGTIPPFDQSKRIACFTSVTTDFNKNTLQALGLSLRNLNGTALFIVKKYKSVLDNLHKWLMANNADYQNGLIDLPLLLIDDEADNASVNTNSEEKDPTAINKGIRNILNCFRQASYLGITATPFANIFINPDYDNDDASRDLFPKDFLTVLPTPEQYIGANKIFGQGDADEWGNEFNQRTGGEYENAIITIKNEEQRTYFVFKHKQDLANQLKDLPESLLEAIRYFILINCITDFRKDVTEHRSMLVNVSRFTKVQNRTADLIEDYLNAVKADLDNYSKLPIEQAMQIPKISSLFNTWNKYNLQTFTRLNWNEFLHDWLNKSTKRIEVRRVNQESSPLNYSEYKHIGFRVIAVGGNGLSRGLTLEGLCVSYFYRNTMMYDTLLQMGRWFGYRPNYDDLFKIWMAEDAVDWYGYITDAVNELKEELIKMKRQNQTPEEFGLKVRQAPGSLLITARNKMRMATSIKRPITVSGRMIETPRLKGDHDSIKRNTELCRNFIKTISAEAKYAFDEYTKAFIWKDVPKKAVIDLVRNYVTHPWNLNFQPIALAEYIASDEGPLDKWDIAIPQDDDASQTVSLSLSDGSDLQIHPKGRPLEWDVISKNMLKVYGRHVRIGAGGCTKIGLTEDRIKDLRKKYGSSKDSTYLHTERKPLLLLHILTNTNPEKKSTDPKLVFALGLGFPYDGKDRTANYMVNTKELRNWVDIEDIDEDDDDENNK